MERARSARLTENIFVTIDVTIDAEFDILFFKFFFLKEKKYI
jgi:DNA polymerase elongation subunit (family B)